MMNGNAARVAEATGFLGTVCTFYVPRARTDDFVAMARTAEVPVRYDEARRTFLADATVIDFSNPAVVALNKGFGPFSDGHAAFKAESRQPGLAAVAAAVAAPARRGDVVPPSPDRVVAHVPPGRESPPGSSPSPARMPLADRQVAARAVAARGAGEAFLAGYVQYGFRLKRRDSDAGRHEHQMGELRSAGPAAIKEVAGRNNEEYRKLVLKEDSIRFAHALDNDPGFMKRLESLRSSGDSDVEARDKLSRSFAMMDNSEKKRLASIGRVDGPVGLTPLERGACSSLAGGFKAMAEVYFEKEGKSLGFDLTSAVARGEAAVSSLSSLLPDDMKEYLGSPQSARARAAPPSKAVPFDEIER